MNAPVDVRAAVDDLKKATIAEGIEPDGVLGQWVKAQAAAMEALANVGDRIENVVRVAERRGEAERETLREQLRAAAYVVSQAKLAQTVTEVARETAIAKVSKDIGPQVIDRLKPWLILRESAWNRKIAWRRAGVVSFLALAVFIGGYCLRAWQDEWATAALARCAAQRLLWPGTSHRICYLDYLMPPSSH